MNQLKDNNSVYDITIRLFILLLIIGWCLMIMLPFASIIVWSIILSMALYPAHSRLTKWMGGRSKLASSLIILAILAVIFLPTWMLIDSLFNEVKQLKANYDAGTLSIPPPSEKVKEWPVIGGTLYETWNNAANDLGETVFKYKDQLMVVGKKLGSGILSVGSSVVQIMAALIIAGVILAIGGAGDAIRKFFRKVAGTRGDEYADMTVVTVGNVVKGILGVALILAILHGLLFLMAGVPLAGIWTLIVFVLAVLQIPLFIVTLPIIVYLFAMKSLTAAIIWTIVLILIGFSDNILRPILLGKGAPVPMLVIFIGVIGGFLFSGFIGLFTGAIVLSLGYRLYLGWIEE